MSWSSATFVTAFDAEAGSTLGALATTAQKIIWFNEGQSRLLKWRPRYTDLTWAADARTVTLPTDFKQMDRELQYTTDVIKEDWRVFGQELVHQHPDGAYGAGGARLYYWAAWPALTDGGSSSCDSQADNACLYYALHRFYKLLSSNRLYYKRYATLVGANAVSEAALSAESDRYYQDFLDSREDQTPNPPAHFYPYR